MRPEVVQELRYEDILEQNKNLVKELLPKWRPAESDNIMLVLRAFAYRELYLRALFNRLARAFFLSTAQGSDLDALAETLYGLERLEGAKPYAAIKLTLLAPLPHPYRVPKGFRLSSESGEYFAKLLEEVVFEPGETQKEASIELQLPIAFLDVRCEIQTSPLPYLKIKQLGPFANGSDPESDEDFKRRIRLSLAHKSTAGSALTYQGYAYAADERIEDVKVISPTPGVVHVIYWSKNMDEAMQERVVKALSAEDVRPLTDQVSVMAAKEIFFEVSAHLVIDPKSDSAKSYVRSIQSLKEAFASPKIGEDISVAKIIDALMVDGVRDARMISPQENLKIDDYSIARLGAVHIDYEVSDEL